MSILKGGMVLYCTVIIDSIILCALILMQQGKSNGLSSLSGQVASDTYWSNIDRVQLKELLKRELEY